MIEIEDALAFLPPELEPPPALEERLVTLLRQEGALRSGDSLATVSPVPATKESERRTIMELRNFHFRLPNWKTVLVGIAAAAVAFLGGLRVGAPRKSAIDALPRFALLLYEGKNFDHGRPGEYLREYTAWARSLSERGISVEGDELSRDSRILHPASGSIRSEAPAPSDEILAGYFIIGAGTLDEAIVIARECPHLKHEGRIEVRPIATR